MHDRVAAAEKRSEESLKEHQRRTKEIEVQFAEKEQVLQNNLRKQMQRMIDEQCKEIEEIKVDFDQATSLLTEKYNRLSENFNELQELYEGRPSRPEDLEMIRDQNEQIE